MNRIPLASAAAVMVAGLAIALGSREAPQAPIPAAALPVAPSAQVPTPLVDEARALIATFSGTLVGELQSAMKAGGPVQAIAVCKERAPRIAADLAAQSGWSVKRTSLKTRNPALNAPDDWERAALVRFEARHGAGEPADTLAFAEVVELGGAPYFRFMKAIPTGEACLACHGTDLAAPVAAALDRDYPQDQARGYGPGDVRGAFSLARRL